MSCKPKQGAQPPGIADGSTTQLIRRLVAQTQGTLPARDGQSLPASQAEKNLLFEEEVDGVRCLLIEVDASERPSLSLSPREREIVRMIAKGLPNKAIADVLDISSWTVSTHLRRIFAKMKVNSRAAMVGCAISTGLLLDHAPACAAPAAANGKRRHTPSH